jgi:hypothetical protein
MYVHCHVQWLEACAPLACPVPQTYQLTHLMGFITLHMRSVYQKAQCRRLWAWYQWTIADIQNLQWTCTTMKSSKCAHNHLHLLALIACLSALQTLACFTCLFLSIAEACDRQQHTHEYHTMFYCDICAQDQFEIKLHMQQRQVELLLHSKRAKRRQAGSKRKSRGELSLMDSFQLCASRSQLQILDMCMCCSLIS